MAKIQIYLINEDGFPIYVIHANGLIVGLNSSEDETGETRYWGYFPDGSTRELYGTDVVKSLD